MFFVIGFDFELGQTGYSKKSSFSGTVVAHYRRLNKLRNWQPYYVLESSNGERREFTYFVRH